jgi:hypothetical protein
MTDVYRLIIKLNETRNDTKKLEEFFRERQPDMSPKTQQVMAGIIAQMHLCEDLLEKMVDHDISTQEAWNAANENYISARERVRALMSKL